MFIKVRLLFLIDHVKEAFQRFVLIYYSKTCVKWPLSKRPQIVFQYQLSLNAGQMYCKIL